MSFFHHKQLMALPFLQNNPELDPLNYFFGQLDESLQIDKCLIYLYMTVQKILKYIGRI
jgi:hypothetical protein